MSSNAILRDTVITVDLNQLDKNIHLIKEMMGEDVALMAVVKANGYGHGACGIADTIVNAGADYLAVATLSEAMELRQQNDHYPLFILGHTPDRLLDYVVENNITQTIFSLSQGRMLNLLAAERQKIVKVHIKVDTGFHRLGQMPSEEFAQEIIEINKLPNVEIEGIFSHLALVDDEENKKQYSMFCDFISNLEAQGCTFKYKHIADSIACVDYPQYRMNMVRPGALIYGMRGFHKGFIPVEQVLTFETRISQLHHVKEGEGASYDYLWKASKDSLIATLPFGYADGYPRNMRDKGYVVINGHKAPIIGVICMDQCMADVTDIPGVTEGTPAIIYGDGSNGSMTIDQVSKLAETNKNDVIARLTPRPPRVYIK